MTLDRPVAGDADLVPTEQAPLGIDHTEVDVGLGVVEAGPPDGVPVVLVHGALDRGSGMARLARQLAEVAHVTRYDRRGYGRAVGLPGPYTVAAHADDLISLLADRPAVLVGHSFGGHVALRAAAQRPDLVLGVAVYEPPMSWAEWWSRDRRPGPTDPGDAAEAFMRRMVGDRRWERLPESTRAARRAEGRAFVGEGSDLRRGRPWEADMIRCEVRVGCGTRTDRRFVRAADEFAALFGSQVVVVPDAGHGAHLSDAARLAELLVMPLGALSGRPPAS